MSNKIPKFLILLVTGYALLVTFSYAEEIDPNAVINQRQQLQEQLNSLEAQIESYRSVIQEKQKQSTTLERDIGILNAQIEKIKLEIKMRNLRISQLSNGINQRVETIGVLSEKIEKERESLSVLLRRTRETDSSSLIEVVLGYEKLSDFFVEADSFEMIQDNIQDSLGEIRGTKQKNEEEKTDLESKKIEETQLRTIQEVERKKLTNAESEKKKILSVTKGEEAKYQKFLADKQKSASTIRSQLFLLTGSPSIPFEKAVEYATLAWQKTGVRPAFLLGVIAEESNLGANIGKGNWTVDLANSRCASQRTAFIQITSELGLDPNLMPVSKKAWYGYCGGAMGPAQFMPTTWQGYKNRISAITGNNPPSPWDPKDAFVAAALYLKDSGATSGSSNAERNAALKYLAGSYWKNPSYAFYGDDVMDLAAKYQEMINVLKGS